MTASDLPEDKDRPEAGLEELLRMKLLQEGVALAGPDLAAAARWYASCIRARPVVEALISLSDEPAVVFVADVGADK